MLKWKPIQDRPVETLTHSSTLDFLSRIYTTFPRTSDKKPNTLEKGTATIPKQYQALSIWLRRFIFLRRWKRVVTSCSDFLKCVVKYVWANLRRKHEVCDQRKNPRNSGGIVFTVTPRHHAGGEEGSDVTVTAIMLVLLPYLSLSRGLSPILAEHWGGWGRDGSKQYIGSGILGTVLSKWHPENMNSRSHVYCSAPCLGWGTTNSRHSSKHSDSFWFVCELLSGEAVGVGGASICAGFQH